MIDIFDNNALIRCIEMLLEEFLELEDDPEKSEAGPKSKGNPLHLAVNGSRFRMIKENLGVEASFGFKIPRKVEFLDTALPKTGTGKIFKRELRDQFWSGMARRVQG